MATTSLQAGFALFAPINFSGNQPISVRSRATKIDRWIKRVFTSLPQKLVESKWGTHANCYAYAMNCKKPHNGNNGGSKPGAINGFVSDSKGNLEDYKQALLAGAFLDGAIPVNDSDIIRPPSPEPGYYLVAAICATTPRTNTVCSERNLFLKRHKSEQITF